MDKSKMLTSLAVRSFLILGLCAITILTDDRNDGNGLPFKPPCATKRMEIAFPHVIDVQNQHVRSVIPGSKRPDRGSPSPSHILPDAFFLEFTWRRRKLQLVLYRSEIAPPTSFTEWEEDNVTIAEATDDRCYYHGYVKGHRSSYVAVSTCSGVAGYAQTDEEILFIEPLSDPQQHTGMQAHLVYTCEEREPPDEDLHTWAPKDLSHGQIDAHWRKKRAARRNPKHLEVFMVVAPSTVRVVGKKKVKNYVMTLMNIVNSIYQHSSLDVDIRVSLVRLDFLHEKTDKRIMVKRNAYQTVRNFCEWAMYLYKPSDPQTHDIAVLLTREELGPAGYAPITGLCNPIRSCAAIKDEGYTSAFIIAHEMAHVFGLFHDGHGNRCHGRKYRTAIMATLVESKLNHYWWSICSQERMKAVVDYLYCLNDDPFQLEGLPEVPDPVGKNWSLNEQCILEFGEQFTLCRAFYADSCNMLWCGDYRNPHICRTKRGPPLPGTPCGRDRQCIEGRCQYIGHQSPVHGRWGYWSSWTPCSTECGVGLRYRSRVCDNPSPKYGGRDCRGGKDEMGTCLNSKCETYTDIRAAECSVWADMNIKPGRHTWKPYPAKRKEDRCKQTCISEQTQQAVTIDLQTEDGTPCSYDDNFNICILGECYTVGCDGVMNSTKKSDKCGVCGGDNSFCKTVTGEFIRKPNKKDEYEQVLFLPHGARNVEITKTEKSPHFLALKDPERGDYYINGNGRPERSQKIVADGALFDYARGQTYESLVSRGPLKKNLEIMLFPAGHLAPASITYSYTVNKDDHTLEMTKYKWKFLKWSDCSVTCGTGIQQILHKCIDKYEETTMNDEMCSYLDKPRQDKATCHRESCDRISYVWAMFNNYTECSATCGDTGFKLQAYGCEKNDPNATIENIVYVEHSFCDHAPAPNYTEPCNRVPCEVQFRYSWKKINDYTECSEPCGESGVLNQLLECERMFPNNTREMVDDIFCEDALKPDTQIPCNILECKNDFSDSWVTLDPVDECSETCGKGGFQMMEVVCERWYMEDDTVEFVDEKFCAHIDKPSGKTSCNRIPCVEQYSHKWVIFERASDCSEPCGEDGVQVQDFGCERQHEDKAAEYVDHSFCSDVPAPNSSVPCNRFPCEGDYYHEWSILDSFTECSETCGEKGFKIHEYGCDRIFADYSVEYVDHTFCLEKTPPREVVPCNREPCGPVYWHEWTMLENYTECSQSCGDAGEKSQVLVCERYFPNNTVETVPDDFCVNMTRPFEAVPCNRFPCESEVEFTFILIDNYTECNETCGDTGVQLQDYVCKMETSNGTIEEVAIDLCQGKEVPLNFLPCNRVPCKQPFTYTWVLLDSYSECSETCGEDGVQVQQYECQRQYDNNTAEDVDSTLCGDVPSEFGTIACNRDTCPEYEDYWVYLDDMTECSATCGDTGVQFEHYACERWWYADDSVELVDNSNCPEDEEPLEEVPCNRIPCILNFRYNWTTFDTFTDCSASCGDAGVKYVHFTCERIFPNGTTEFVNDKFCSKIPTPDEPIPCNRFQCVLNWTVGEWSQCSKTCGMGVQTREVFCGDPVNWSVDDVCSEDIPLPEKICNMGPCISDDFRSCKKDKYAFCKHSSIKKCRFAGFRKMCCRTCFKGTGAAFRRWKRLVRQKRKLRIKRRLKARRRQNRILKYNKIL